MSVLGMLIPLPKSSLPPLKLLLPLPNTIIAPAQPPATGAAVYTALFTFMILHTYLTMFLAYCFAIMQS